jgi:hypothetical protein
MLTALRLAAALMMVFGVADEAPAIWGDKLPSELASIVQLGAVFCVVYAICEFVEAAQRMWAAWQRRIMVQNESAKQK